MDINSRTKMRWVVIGLTQFAALPRYWKTCKNVSNWARRGETSWQFRALLPIHPRREDSLWLLTDRNKNIEWSIELAVRKSCISVHLCGSWRSSCSGWEDFTNDQMMITLSTTPWKMYYVSGDKCRLQILRYTPPYRPVTRCEVGLKVLVELWVACMCCTQGLKSGTDFLCLVTAEDPWPTQETMVPANGALWQKSRFTKDENPRLV